MLPYNDTNGVTIIVTPLEVIIVGNMNNILLLTPIPIMATTGLYLLIIALIVASYFPQNS